MNDNDWRDMLRLVSKLWPTWQPTPEMAHEYKFRMAGRKRDTVERAIRDHYATDEHFGQPKLSVLLNRCTVIAEGKQPKKLSYEAAEDLRAANADDAIALELIRTFDPKRLEDAIRVAIAAGCITEAPRQDPESWSRHERGFVAAADWLIRTDPSKADRIIRNHNSAKYESMAARR